MTPRVSVVIPVYNEEESLPALFARLYPALDALGSTYEVVFVNDGSQDRSAAMLREQYQKRPDVTRVILFNGNFGQHMAIIAGFDHCRGERVVTLDADLQNPPEEIANLLAKMDEGHDYVGSIRRKRQDAAWRRFGLGQPLLLVDELAAQAEAAAQRERQLARHRQHGAVLAQLQRLPQRRLARRPLRHHEGHAASAHSSPDRAVSGPAQFGRARFFR